MKLSNVVLRLVLAALAVTGCSNGGDGSDQVGEAASAVDVETDDEVVRAQPVKVERQFLDGPIWDEGSIGTVAVTTADGEPIVEGEPFDLPGRPMEEVIGPDGSVERLQNTVLTNLDPGRYEVTVRNYPCEAACESTLPGPDEAPATTCSGTITVADEELDVIVRMDDSSCAIESG